MSKNNNQKWRRTREYRIWRAAVVRRDKVCTACSNRKTRHAHHIKSASYFKELRFDVDNGTTLCQKCHSALHNKLVGGYRKKCTEKDYERFLNLRNYWKEKFDV